MDGYYHPINLFLLAVRNPINIPKAKYSQPRLLTLEIYSNYWWNSQVQVIEYSFVGRSPTKIDRFNNYIVINLYLEFDYPYKILTTIDISVHNACTSNHVLQIIFDCSLAILFKKRLS